ncbi:MAG: hypothetical protein HDR86_09195 [Bacteroides sp.]|nr:hypothetical protein [Bacteroides sp.]
MKKKEILAALKSRIQPLENSEAGEMRGGFAEFADSIQNLVDGNGTCIDNDICSNNGTCVNNKGCSNNGACQGKSSKSIEDSDVMNVGDIF